MATSNNLIRCEEKRVTKYFRENQLHYWKQKAQEEKIKTHFDLAIIQIYTCYGVYPSHSSVY